MDVVEGRQRKVALAREWMQLGMCVGLVLRVVFFGRAAWVLEESGFYV